MIGCEPEWGQGDLHTPGAEDASPGLCGLQEPLGSWERLQEVESLGAAGRRSWAGQGWGPTVAHVSRVGLWDPVKTEEAARPGPGPGESASGQWC